MAIKNTARKPALKIRPIRIKKSDADKVKGGIDRIIDRLDRPIDRP
jgi:hypothetical protein